MEVRRTRIKELAGIIDELTTKELFIGLAPDETQQRNKAYAEYTQILEEIRAEQKAVKETKRQLNENKTNPAR